MRKNISNLTCLLLVASLSGFFACSKDNPRGQNREATSAQQSSSPTSQAPTQQPPAAPQSPNSSPQISVGAKVTGTPATEKYHLRLTNYAKVPVTVSINGEWIGQWDNSADVPLESVLQGKNQLTVELASEPKSIVTIDIATKRDNNDVKILSLNFQGQTGTHTYTFVAK